MSALCRITMHCLCPAYKPYNEGSLTLSADDFHSYMDDFCQLHCTQSLHPHVESVFQNAWTALVHACLLSAALHTVPQSPVSNRCFRMHRRHLRRAAELPASLGLLCSCYTGCINSVTAIGRGILPKAREKVTFSNIYLLRLVDRQRQQAFFKHRRSSSFAPSRV